MAKLPYKKNFQNGRQSDQFLNEQLHIIFEALRNINYRKNENNGEIPDSKLDGALWFDKVEEALKYWDLRTNSWKPAFSSKFQITDQLLNEIVPSNPVTGQLWIYNGVLMYFDGAEWKTVKAANQDSSQWSNAAFEDYALISPLNTIGSRVINDTHESINVIVPPENEWGSEEYEEPYIQEPSTPHIPDENERSQFIVPNIRTDRIFIDHTMRTDYEKVSQVCFQYPLPETYDKTVSAIHVNPGKVVKIKKRFIKVDKANSTIKVSSYNTEFYGFRKGEYTGDLLIKSNTQDYGDFIPSGEYIILNYNATQNYDYILAVTFEFSWMKSSGSVNVLNNTDDTNTFFLANLKSPLNIHTDGLKLEEAAYEIDMSNNTVTVDDDTSKIELQMWSPYRKQFGYIREIDLEGNAIIKLTQKVYAPLVFVGGMLIHPTFGGLKRDLTAQKIIVPKIGNGSSMRNMPWCVVDLVSDDYQQMYADRGIVKEVSKKEVTGSIDWTYEVDRYIIDGYLHLDTDNDGFREYLLDEGTLSGQDEFVITYNTENITESDGIILFVDGLMVNNNSIERSQEGNVGYLKLSSGFTEGQEYVLIRDRDGILFTSDDIGSAFATGYLDDSLVYLDGKLIVNENAVATVFTEEEEIADGAIFNEIKYFITNENNNEGSWKIYDEYNGVWHELNSDIEFVKEITSSYTNSTVAVKINVEDIKGNNPKRLDVYAYRFANTMSGALKFGRASHVTPDTEENARIYKLGTSSYIYGQNTINLFKNGVKMIPNVDYKELNESNYIKVFYRDDFDEEIRDKERDKDIITFFIEPVEDGEPRAKDVIVLEKEDSLQPNVYSIGDDQNIPDLYPGRLEVYINGLRLPQNQWILLDNRRILLNISYTALGTAENYPEEKKLINNQLFTLTHSNPDTIMIEIRKDYSRNENTIDLGVKEGNRVIYLDEYNLNSEILDTNDEILFFLNGQFCNLSKAAGDYTIDRYKKCITFNNQIFCNMLMNDPLKTALDRNSFMYASWKKNTGRSEYKSNVKNALTIVWR